LNALRDHKRFDERANVLGLPNYHEIQSRVPKGSLELRSVEHSVQNPNEIVHLFFINKNNLQGCSHVRVIIGNHEMAAILDCGSQTSFITEELYNKLISNPIESLEMPIRNAFWSVLSVTVLEELRTRQCLK
jgi:hypothetical protein